MSLDAAHRWARRRTYRPPSAGSPTRAGNPGTKRCALRPRQPRSQAGPAGRRRTPARPFRIDCPTRGEYEVAYSRNVKHEFLDWSDVAPGRNGRPQPGGGVLNLDGVKVLSTRRRTRRPPARARVIALCAHHAPEALQRRVSLVLVTRTQVQPVSLQTRSSPAPSAPQL